MSVMRLFIQVIFVGIVIVFTGLIILRIVSGEDTWICDNGVWVKHGQPLSSMPSEDCPQK
jgi:hypothetical protein